MSNDDTVTLTHPDGHGPIDVPARRAQLLIRQGWQPATDNDTPDPVDTTVDNVDGSDDYSADYIDGDTSTPAGPVLQGTTTHTSPQEDTHG